MGSYLCWGAHCNNEVVAPRTICQTCWDHRALHRDTLPELWVRAHTLLPPSAPPIDLTRVGGRRSSSAPPMRLAVYAAIEQVLTGVVGWALWVRQLADHPPLPGLATVRASFLFQRAIDSLKLWDQVLADSALRLDYCDGLYRMHRALVEVCGEARDARIERPCPECRSMTIISRAGADYFACLTCGARWSYPQFVALTVDDQQTTTTSLDYRAVDAKYAEPGNVPAVDRQTLTPEPEPAVVLMARVRRELAAANGHSRRRGRRR